MPRLWRLLTLVLYLLLGGCVPGVSPGRAPAEKLLVFPGGWIEGRWVHQGEQTFSLPAPPLDADAAGSLLGVVYDYSWQRYRDGELEYEATLPYPAVRLHATPAWLVVLARGVFSEAAGWLDYPAQDAINGPDGIFWVNQEGLWRGPRKLLSGGFERVLPLEDRVLALGRQRAVFWPDEEELELPADWLEAAVGNNDLYLLTPSGLHRYDPAGFELGFYPGNFEDLAVDPAGNVWLAEATGRAVELTPQLEEAW